ncbi:MAG: SAM-dependent methyltransferase [Polyangiales bacterium]
MRPGLPSGTSLLVSFARGLGVDKQQIDPLASQLLPPVLAQLAVAPRHLGGVAGLYRAAVRATTFGLIDHMVLRTQAIDAHLASALRTGIDQLVILGAGLDARAWRLEALKDVTVFEVDHPATQQYKRKRMSRKHPPADIRYVSVDFEKERFSNALERAGFRPGAPSAWIWEGVAMYLPLDVVHDTLGQLTSLAAAGSDLAMTYRVPGLLPYGSLGRLAIPAVFAAAGEPLKATLQPHELASAVAPDWKVTFDEDSRGWRKLTGSTANASRSFWSERLAIVKRLG